MGKRRKRLAWADDEKRSICQQTAVPGVSVGQVARRYAMNANMIFKWLKDPRFSPKPVEAEEAVFLPVEIEASAYDASSTLPEPALSEPIAAPGGRIEIELAGSHRISAEGGFDPDLLARLLKELMS